MKIIVDFTTNVCSLFQLRGQTGLFIIYNLSVGKGNVFIIDILLKQLHAIQHNLHKIVTILI